MFSSILATPRITTTLIPLNICPIEYCQTTKPTPVVNIIETRPEQNILTDKSKDNVTTHLIGDWIIRESCESFRRKENERFTPINQPLNQEKKINTNEAIIPHSALSPNVMEWTVSSVSMISDEFFKQVTIRS